MGFFSKIGQGLKKTRDSLMNSVSSVLKGFTRIDDELFEELEEILVMGDVGANTATRICAQLRTEVKEQGITDPMAIRTLMQKIVADMLVIKVHTFFCQIYRGNTLVIGGFCALHIALLFQPGDHLGNGTLGHIQFLGHFTHRGCGIRADSHHKVNLAHV